MERVVVAPEQDVAPLVQGGRYVFVADEGFRAVFRPAGRGRSFALFALAVLLLVGGTLQLLLREPTFQPLAWGIAILVDFTLIWALHIVRRALDRGPLVVDGAERKVFLPQGAEVAFGRLRALRVDGGGVAAELVLEHEEGAIRFGRRPLAEVQAAAAAVSRLTDLPLQGGAAGG